jgi:hypothetical protein
MNENATFLGLYGGGIWSSKKVVSPKRFHFCRIPGQGGGLPERSEHGIGEGQKKKMRSRSKNERECNIFEVLRWGHLEL